LRLVKSIIIWFIFEFSFQLKAKSKTLKQPDQNSTKN